MPRCPPILKRPHPSSRNNGDDEHGTPRKHWTAYLGPIGLIILLMVPQPSWIIVLSSPYVSPTRLLLHLTVTTVLTLLAMNSLAICTLRDPGRPKIDDIDSSESRHGPRGGLTVDHFDEEGEALLEGEGEDPNDFNSPRKWCRTCWAPKPDRTHHCSSCGRCVLKMDHHCPWVSQCVGHRTHAAFLHLLLCVTLLALYIGINAGLILYDFVFAPVAQPVMDSTPLHCLFLVIMGFIFSMVIGSFFGFHVYLSFTNQTTLEQLSPFHLLKYLPKPKAPRRAPGIGTSLPGIATRNIPVPEVSGLAPTDESPYYFPSPPATPPPAPEAIDALRHALLASNPFSTIPPSAPDTPTDLTPGRVFSSSPVATTHPHNTLPVLHTSADAHSSAAGHAEWDEDSLSFAQRRLVRRTADRLGLWDLGWRRNVIAVLGSGDTSTRRRGRSRDDEGGTSLAGSGSTSRLRGGGVRRVAGRGHPKAYGWRWWFSVLLNGGPPRGDGRTFPRNPKARGMLEELRRGLEEEERGETRRPVDFRAAAGGPRSGRRGHDEGTELRGI